MGTPAYLAPEVIMTTKGQTYDGKVRPARDSVQLCCAHPVAWVCGNSAVRRVCVLCVKALVCKAAALLVHASQWVATS